MGWKIRRDEVRKGLKEGGGGEGQGGKVRVEWKESMLLCVMCDKIRYTS